MMWTLLLGAVVAFALSGIPALFFAARSVAGQRLAFAFMATASVLGWCGLVAGAFGFAHADGLSWAWTLPWGQFSLGLDPLSAFFLALVFTVPTLASAFGLEYWRQSEHAGSRLGIALGVLTAAMALVVLSRDGVLFLLAWEAMALAAFFAITTEDGDPEVRSAGWVYLVATHVGTLFLLVLFVLWSVQTGSFSLSVFPAGTELAGVLFFFALVGFGFKAGLVPLHFWLPGAHARAPSHVSAVLSGVMLKMGVYGLFRMASLLPLTEGWGLTVLLVGLASALLGVLFALGQSDLKRLLAYSSIENMGLVLTGLGLALVGRAQGRDDWVLLGMAGALLHVWNHGLFKPLLFFNAGAVLHATHTREIDRLGGLGRLMPLSLGLFAVGAMAITGLPPLNGLVSEWLLSLGFFQALRGLGSAQGLALAAVAPVLALVGALVLACFVKALGAVYLGQPRVARSEIRDPGPAMLVPMFLLAALCLAIGLGSPLLSGLLQGVVASWDPSLGNSTLLSVLAPTTWVSALGLLLVAAVVLAGAFLWLRPRPRSAVTWDCGYAEPSARMQYTGTSLTDTMVKLTGTSVANKDSVAVSDGAFPRRAVFGRRVPDLVLDRFLLPVTTFVGKQLPRIRFFQMGQTHVYVLYVFGSTIFLFVLAGLWGRF